MNCDASRGCKVKAKMIEVCKAHECVAYKANEMFEFIFVFLDQAS